MPIENFEDMVDMHKDKYEKFKKKESIKEHLYKGPSRNYPELEPYLSLMEADIIKRGKYKNKGEYNGKKPYWRKKRRLQARHKARHKRELEELRREELENSA